MKTGWNRKEGKGNKDFKKEGMLGQGVGALRKGRGAETPVQTLSTTFKQKKRQSTIEFDVFILCFTLFIPLSKTIM